MFDTLSQFHGLQIIIENITNQRSGNTKKEISSNLAAFFTVSVIHLSHLNRCFSTPMARSMEHRVLVCAALYATCPGVVGCRYGVIKYCLCAYLNKLGHFFIFFKYMIYVVFLTTMEFPHF